MLHHKHRNDLDKRAADIAEREAEEVYKRTGSYPQWSAEWERVYKEALKELSS